RELLRHPGGGSRNGPRADRRCSRLHVLARLPGPSRRWRFVGGVLACQLNHEDRTIDEKGNPPPMSRNIRATVAAAAGGLVAPMLLLAPPASAAPLVVTNSTELVAAITTTNATPG